MVSNGKVLIEGNETVEINGHGDGVSIDGNASVKIKSEKEVDIIGGCCHHIYTVVILIWLMVMVPH